MPVREMNASISANRGFGDVVMHHTISAVADASSIFYRGRAKSSAFADISRMDTNWRQRLDAALKEKKISMRKASLDAGFAAGYVQSILCPKKA